jgi:hypothetical protein
VKSLITGISAIALAGMMLSVTAPAFAATGGGCLVQGVNNCAVAGAVQHNGGNHVIDSGHQKAQIEDSAFDFATGNIGANVAAGNGNQQSNITYLDSGQNNLDLGAGAWQSNGGNFFGWGDEHNAAQITDQAFENAKGNIGANVAAGNMNQQSNVAVILTTDELNSLAALSLQSNGGSCYIDNDGNRAQINDNAFGGVSGNVGANVAAGNANQQSNVLVINNNSLPTNP